MPATGTPFSAALGATLDESAAGVPHGLVRWTTAGHIRAAGGSVEHAPEPGPDSGTINRQHVHVVEGGGASAFGPPQPNPVPKRERFGGPEYREPAYLNEE
jgi:hypothetical protein